MDHFPPTQSIQRYTAKESTLPDRQLSLVCSLGIVALSVSEPGFAEPLDDYREVAFELPNQGKHRAVFFLLPNKDSDDPCESKTAADWDVPVRWDDNTMLFVPSLDDSAITSAMKHIIDNGHSSDAFESEHDIG